jgi:GNAT superfamily N-acetyltransferase
MKSNRFWEELGSNIMPSFAHILYDGWLLRFTHGYARNNNCVWPLYEGSMSLADKVTFCEEQYAARGSTCGFRLAGLPEHEAIEALLIARGYGRANPNLVMTRDSVAGPNAAITELAMDEWLETIYRIRPGDPNIKAWERQVYQRLALPSRYVVVKRGDGVCGYGRSVRQGNVLNVIDLWILPDFRSQGLGTQLVHGLLQLGQADGATTACLSVNEDNDGARRLYERLGFVNRYLYWYMVPAEEAD